MPKDQLTSCQSWQPVLTPEKLDQPDLDEYRDLFKALRSELTRDEFSLEVDPSGSKGVMRVALLGLGSPMWADGQNRRTR